jgi:hypothetical protein
MRRHLITTAIVVVGLVLATSSAFADKGGGGHNNGGTKGSAPTVTASPNPGTVGQPVFVSGCGFAFEPVVLQVVQPDGYIQNYNVAMWANGCMDSAYFVPTETGTYTVNILQNSGHNLAIVATTQESVS